jgi:hypothetical protein
MCRPTSTFKEHLPYKKENIGAYNGDSWTKDSNNLSWIHGKSKHSEPEPGFMKVFRKDGTPFDNPKSN